MSLPFVPSQQPRDHRLEPEPGWRPSPLPLLERLSPADVLAWLRQGDPAALEPLWQVADRTREAWVGDEVHLRGLVEISNYCRRSCTYCGIRKPRTSVRRYRMTREEVLECAKDAMRFGYGTVVLQAGEDPALDSAWVDRLVRSIKGETGLAVTLSLGERSDREWAAWREAGADRYLLRFETSDDALFRLIHPSVGGRAPSRLPMLERLKQLGYEVGSGIMVGIPGQSWASLARDIVQFAELGLDMIGVGPYLPHPDTPLGSMAPRVGPEQVVNTTELVCRVVALSRLACPRAHIPSTTALAAAGGMRGRIMGLCRGANVVMPNLTPSRYREQYDIYPGKAGAAETAELGHRQLVEQIESLGRRVGQGPGSAARHGCERMPAEPTRQGDRPDR